MNILKRINPFSSKNPMSLKDAAILATISAAVVWALGFFANSEFEAIQAAPTEWAFNAIKNYLVAWFGNFGTMAGIEQIIKMSKEK